jgi:hypothetical protein
MDTVSNFTFHSFNIQQGKNVWHLAYFSYHISPPEYDLQVNDICTLHLRKQFIYTCIGMVINVI